MGCDQKWNRKFLDFPFGRDPFEAYKGTRYPPPIGIWKVPPCFWCRPSLGPIQICRQLLAWPLTSTAGHSSPYWGHQTVGPVLITHPENTSLSFLWRTLANLSLSLVDQPWEWWPAPSCPATASCPGRRPSPTSWRSSDRGWRFTSARTPSYSSTLSAASDATTEELWS